MRVAAVLTAFLLATLAGCVDPDLLPRDGPDGARLPPEAAIPDVIGRITHVAHAADVPTGGGIWVEGHHLYVSSLGQGFHVVDILDPEDPKLVGRISGDDIYTRFLGLYHTQGRTIVVGAGQATGMHFIDVTDPTNPTITATIATEDLDGQPVHNVVVVTGTTLIYNNPSTGTGNPNHIVDGADPESPKVVGRFGDHGCHHITVTIHLQRAYCAGVQESQIWDITDPLEPELKGRFSDPRVDTAGQLRRQVMPNVPSDAWGPVQEQLPYSMPPRGLHHTAIPNADGTLLIISDEWQGGGRPGGCLLHAEAPTGQTVSSPTGAMFFVDARDEASPELISWYAPQVPDSDEPDANCTQHFLILVPGKTQVVSSWYTAGVILVDFADPEHPRQVAQWADATGTWDVRMHRGWIFTGDLARGADVLRFDP